MVDLLKFPAQFARPGLLIMFIELAEFSQQVSIAQGMFSRQTEIRVPSVVNHDALEIRQDTCRVDRFIPPLSMEGVERRPRVCLADVSEPQHDAGNVYAGQKLMSPLLVSRR
jgi:hypothetical protein